MRHRWFKLKTRPALRIIVYLMIGSLLLVSVPSGQLSATPAAGGKHIFFGPANDVGPSDGFVLSIAVGDLDNDGDLDIASGSSGAEDYQLIVWQNDGTPFTDLWSQNDAGAVTGAAESVALGDLDNDGDLDMVCGGQSLIVLENDGSPFTGLWSQNGVGAAYSEESVALADLDNDGDLDIVSGLWTVRVWENDGSPFSGSWTQNDIGAWSFVNSVGVGDLDGDGDPDIVCAIGHIAEIIAWENDGTPFSDSWSRQDVGTSTDTVSSLDLGDLDNDGDLDIVSRSNTGEDYEVIAWENDGSPFTDLWSPNDVGAAKECSIALGDVDDDGDLDIVSAEGDAPSVKENDGTPFTDLWRSTHVGGGTANVYSVALGDLDGDEDLDIVTGGHWGDDYQVIAWKNTSAYANFLPCLSKHYPLIFCDNFSNPTSGWYVGDTPNVNWGYYQGEYGILLRQTYWWAAAAAPVTGFTDYSVEAEMRLHAGKSCYYGLIFGLKDWDHFYLLLVDPGRTRFSVWKRDADWVLLKDWVYTMDIEPAAGTNHLKVVREGSKITIRINRSQNQPTTLNDGTYRGNVAVGLYAATEYYAPANVRFDNFCARELRAAAAPGDVTEVQELETPAGAGLDPPPAR